METSAPELGKHGDGGGGGRLGEKGDRKETQLVPELAVRIGNLINEAKCVT